MQQFFCAQKEVKYIQQEGQNFLIKNEDYKKDMTNFLMAGLKTLGYSKTLQQLEDESNQSLKKSFDEKFKNFLLNKNFDQAIVYLQESDFNQNQREYLHYEILKLKFIQSILNRDVMIGLYLLRNELINFDKYFPREKENLAKMYLMKSKSEINSIVGFDMTNNDSYTYKINQIEFKTLLEDTQLTEDPFVTMYKNHLSYQFLTCQYHKEAKFTGSEDFPSITNLQHTCQLDHIPDKVIQKFEKVYCELWKVRVTKDGMYVLANGQNQLFCWKYDQPSDSYKMMWQNNAYEEEDILDWDIMQSQNKIIVSVNFKILVILDFLKGTEINTIKDSHKDIIKNIYVFKSEEKFITGSIDGTLVIRHINEPEKKLHEINTNRVVQLVISNNEQFGFALHGDLRSISLINLVKYSSTNFIIEKDQINSMSISDDNQYLLINTGRDVPELHLWNIQGHVQQSFVLQCGFFTKEIIYCGSEDGRLYFWHINNSSPITHLQLGLSAINDAQVFQHPITKKKQIITASDNSIITLIEQIIQSKSFEIRIDLKFCFCY